MSRITRTQTSPILSRAVEYHGSISTSGLGARYSAGDVTAQTTDILEQADALLEEHGTDRTRLLQAQIFLKRIEDRDAVNAVWRVWLPEGLAPARACVQAELAAPELLVEIMLISTK